MTLNRRFTLPMHGVIELVLGLATLVSPALLGFAHTGLVVAVVLGSMLIGMAVTAGADQGASPFASLAWHHLFDLAFLIATAVAALGLALVGDARAGLFFVALTVLQAGLNVATRYVAAT